METVKATSETEDTEARFREHVKNSCIRKFSPLYFTGRYLCLVLLVLDIFLLD
jgi:hypothetical protein